MDSIVMTSRPAVGIRCSCVFYTGYGKNRAKTLDKHYNIVYYIIMYHHG